jgi:hypothetical protein
MLKQRLCTNIHICVEDVDLICSEIHPAHTICLCQRIPVEMEASAKFSLKSLGDIKFEWIYNALGMYLKAMVSILLGIF